VRGEIRMELYDERWLFAGLEGESESQRWFWVRMAARRAVGVENLLVRNFSRMAIAALPQDG
jgi:hypothetical protein